MVTRTPDTLRCGPDFPVCIGVPVLSILWRIPASWPASSLETPSQLFLSWEPRKADPPTRTPDPPPHPAPIWLPPSAPADSWSVASAGPGKAAISPAQGRTGSLRPAACACSKAFESNPPTAAGPSAFPDFEDASQIYVGSGFSHMLVLKLPPWTSHP